jgi:UDP-galactopyranose mutase
LRFEFAYYDAETYQEVAQENYPSEHAFTRITEFKHMTGQRAYGTTVAVEYPQAYLQGQNTPYYPIPREENQERYNRYLKEAQELKDTVLFAGRLADYRYYNMDQVVARALAVFEKEIVGVHSYA